MVKDPIVTELFELIYANDVSKAISILDEHPEFLDYGEKSMPSWLHCAAVRGLDEFLLKLLDRGLDINTTDDLGTSTPLIKAIDYDRTEMVELLLRRNADPNVGRTLIAALNRPDAAVALEITKLLVVYGVDVNRSFEWFNNRDITFTPLEFAESNDRPEIAAFLRANGAVDREQADESAADESGAVDSSTATSDDPITDRHAEIVAHFAAQFGPVDPRSQNEIVPTGLPVSIHVIPPDANRKHMVLFTTGMSAEPMTVPDGAEDFQYAELMMFLPGDWPLKGDALKSRDNAWPFLWLRSIARWPHENKSWIGYPVTIIANGNPPKPLASNAPFTSLMIMHRDDFTTSDGTKIHKYIVLPLYKEEHALEVNEDLPTLMRAFDAHNISDVVDLNRVNVGLGGIR